MNNLDAIPVAQMACSFWQLVSNSVEESIKRGNSYLMIYEETGAPDRNEYTEHTKWTDNRIAVPVLFNLYHGIELSLKSLLISMNAEMKNTHKLSELLEELNKLQADEKLNYFYSKYILNEKLHPIIRRFCDESDMTMDLYYQSLKYPTHNKGYSFNTTLLHYNGSKAKELFEEIKSDLDLMISYLQEVISNNIKA